MENNGNWKTVGLDIKLHKGKLANIDEAEHVFGYLINNMNDINNQKSLYDLTLQLGYTINVI